MLLRRSTACGCGNLPNNVRSAEGESGREEGGKGGGRSRLGEQHQIVVDRGGGRTKRLLRGRVPKIKTFMGQFVVENLYVFETANATEILDLFRYGA